MSALPVIYNHSPSDGMKLLGLGGLPAPAACFVCGSGNYDEGYVDLGVYYDYYGELLLCTACLFKAAEIAGAYLPEVKKLAEDMVTSQAEEIRRLTKELDEARARLAVFNGMVADYVSSQPIALIDDVTGTAVPSDSGNDSATASGSEAVNASESKPAEPVKGAGSKPPRRAANSNSGPELKL